MLNEDYMISYRHSRQFFRNKIWVFRSMILHNADANSSEDAAAASVFRIEDISVLKMERTVSPETIVHVLYSVRSQGTIALMFATMRSQNLKSFT